MYAVCVQAYGSSSPAAGHTHLQGQASSRVSIDLEHGNGQHVLQTTSATAAPKAIQAAPHTSLPIKPSLAASRGTAVAAALAAYAGCTSPAVPGSPNADAAPRGSKGSAESLPGTGGSGKSSLSAADRQPVLDELARLTADLAAEVDDHQLIVQEVVASGGYGTVYRGTWQGLPVAVKTVLFSTASINRRLALQEAALSKSISHPNIVATYAVDAKPLGVERSVTHVSSMAAAQAAAAAAGHEGMTMAQIQVGHLLLDHSLSHALLHSAHWKGSGLGYCQLHYKYKSKAKFAVTCKCLACWQGVLPYVPAAWVYCKHSLYLYGCPPHSGTVLS